MMSGEPVPAQRRRFVDAHFHLWNAANGWYSFPTPEADFGLGDVSAFPTHFLHDDYQRALAPVIVTKCVHVSAANSPAAALDETRWLAALSGEQGIPNAIIGTLDTEKSLADLEKDLDEQMSTTLYRGIRLLHGLDYGSRYGRDLLRILSERSLVYDAVAHPGGGIMAVARAADRHSDLTIILEHTGWPLQTDIAHWTNWKAEIDDLASLPNANCKLSGLGMTFHRTDELEFRRYWDYCIEKFGADRCMFASNFPVDSLYGSFDDLLRVFEATASDLTSREADALFGSTAERVYRI